MGRLDRMLARLPSGCKYPLQSKADPALQIPPSNPFFVKPPLREISQPPGACPIVLISAPGAVGKTTLAAFLASEKKCHLWDLSRLSLGSNTFVGTIAHSFGASNLGLILHELAAGQILFVLDALDEAEVISGGWNPLELFLRELYNCVHEAPNTCIIMLARSETAALIGYFLDEMAGAGPRKHATYEIDYFDEQPSREFVTVQLDRLCTERKQHPMHRRHPKPFEEALAVVFGRLQRSLSSDQGDPWCNPNVHTFLGYAPVLQAIASYMATFDNFQRVEDALSGEDIIVDGTSLVSRLMGYLLRREHEKLIAGIKKQSIPEAQSWAHWDTLYTPEEQLQRVFLYSQGDDAANKCPQGGVPPWLVRPYETAIASFLPQHPFLRERSFAGPAFRDYALAYLLVNGEIVERVKAALDGPRYSRFEEARYIPTPLLAQFYLDIGDGSAPGDHAGYLYESALCRHGINARPRAIIVAPNPNGDAVTTHHLEVFDESLNDKATNSQCISDVTIKLNVSEDHPVVFGRRIRHALLSIRGKLVIGSPHDEFEIMDTEASVTSIEVRSPTIIARVHDPSSRIILEAERCIQVPSVLRVDRIGQGPVTISWPGGDRHPWAPYYVKDVPEESHDLRGAMLALRRILIWFKKDKRSDLARYKLLIDNVAVGHSVLRRQLRDYLRRDHILVEDGPLYKIDLSRARRVGINWLSVRHHDPSLPLRQFLERFLAWASVETASGQIC